jgi:hypothetical protein
MRHLKKKVDSPILKSDIIKLMHGQAIWSDVGKDKPREICLFDKTAGVFVTVEQFRINQKKYAEHRHLHIYKKRGRKNRQVSRSVFVKVD